MKKLLYSISSLLLGIFFLTTSSVVIGQTPSVSVIQPNGGEEWVVGTSHLISWTDNLTKPVMIILSTDGGLNYSDTLSHSVSGTTWTWNIPTSQDTSSQCMIKIVSTTNSSISATSNAFFAIRATLPADSNAIIQPNGGEKWADGTSHLISWTNYVSKAAIQLSINGGRTYTTLPGADSISGSTFTWNISKSQALSDSCFIKIVSIHDTSVYVKSDSLFSIVATPADGSIKLLQPTDAGIHWKIGTEHLISWSDNFPDSVKVVLMRGNTVYSVLSTKAYGSSYAWTIADSIPSDTNYRIKVSNAVDSTIADTSAHYFSIDTISANDTTAPAKTITLVQPNGGENWAVKTSHLISWYDNFSSPVKIELLRAGTLYSVLAPSVSGNGFAWTVSDTIPVDTTYKIKVLNTSDTAITDTSNASFSILATPLGGTIKLIQPNSGDQWALRTIHLVSWTDNFTDPVMVKLMRGNTVYAVLDSSATDNRFAWTISDTIPVGTNYKIKVFNTADTSINDSSDSTFSIIAHPLGQTITLVQPNGGDKWAVGEQHLISWYENFTDPVKVELFHADTLYRVLDSSNTDNRYVWTVPDTLPIDSLYKIKIINTVDPTIWDQSDTTFSILAHPLGQSITLVQPNGGEKWAVGESHLMSWLENFTAPVRVELYHADTLYTVLDSSNTDNRYTWTLPDTIPIDSSYRVKVIDTQDTSIWSESDTTFTVLAHPLNQAIKLVQPNGGDHWAYGEEHLISWYENFTAPVKVELYHADTLYAVLDSSNTDNRLPWTVPDTLPTDSSYRIRVINTLFPSIWDQSDTTFAILKHPLHQTITLIQPNGGDHWAVNTAHLLSWKENFTDPVRVELYHADTLYSVLDSSNTNNRYAWNISDTIPIDSTYRVKVVDTGDSTIWDQSDTTFSVVAFVPGGEVKVIQPNLIGIRWARGTAHIISWTDNLTEPVNIDLFNTADSSIRVIAHGVTGSTYAWTIPDTLALSNTYKVKVSSSLQPVSDMSDTTFSIVAYVPGGTVKVIQPNGGDKWTLGTAHIISWTDNLTEPVNIYLIDTVASDTSLIASGVEGSTYSWLISDTLTLGNRYKIKVASSLQPISDVSDSTFSLVKYLPGGTITVEQPNGGEAWTPGSAHLVSWTKNFAQNVKVELLKADTLYGVLDSNAEGNSITWTISDTIPMDNNYKIKVISTVDSTIWDESDTTFSITNAPPGGYITIVQPNGGETWYQGDAYLISWQGNLQDNYNIYLAHYNASNVLNFVDTIAKNVPPSTYTWTIPSNQEQGAHYRIKITGSKLTAVVDSSDNYFSIMSPSKISTSTTDITAYPNPSTNFITLKVKKTSSNVNYLVTVYNRYGTCIWKGSLNSANPNGLRFATYDLPNGIYFATLSGGQKPMSQIFIVQH
ncbi:MAG: T9SS type A sorting domain-containing protein [Bacteroidales bacterium]|nr:T9SS type A sorting domain-containing protein [Bacteroidales bacterium]